MLRISNVQRLPKLMSNFAPSSSTNVIHPVYVRVCPSRCNQVNGASRVHHATSTLTTTMLPARHVVLCILAIITLSIATNTIQSHYQAPGGVNYDESRFVLPRDLHSLSATEFTTLGHPLFPNYSVRIKESDFCDGTVR